MEILEKRNERKGRGKIRPVDKLLNTVCETTYI